jgi:hypothetical protein
MPRPYVVGSENIAVSAAQDLLQIKGAAGKILEILRVWAGATDTTLVTAQGLRFRCRYLPATVTDGSGGSTSTPRPFDPGDAAASFTCLTNNTTQATTSGTAAVLPVEGDHIFSGCNLPFKNPPQIGPSESFTFELLSTVSGTVHLSSGAEVTERGG